MNKCGESPWADDAEVNVDIITSYFTSRILCYDIVMNVSDSREIYFFFTEKFIK